MQAAISPKLAPPVDTCEALPPVELDAHEDRLSSAQGTILATVLSLFLWVGIFGLASILVLPR